MVGRGCDDGDRYGTTEEDLGQVDKGYGVTFGHEREKKNVGTCTIGRNWTHFFNLMVLTSYNLEAFYRFFF